MIRWFVFVAARSFTNRLLSRLRQLRNVRYLISFVVAMAYFWFTGFRHFFSTKSSAAILVVTTPSALTVDVAALILLSMMILAWALPEQEAGLKFSEAEIQFLFPAPLTRRQLLIYKTLRQQPQVLLSALLISFFGLRRGNFFGLWICFIVLGVYFTFVALGRARLKLAGIGFLIRLAAVSLVATGVVTLLASSFDSAGFKSPAKAMRAGGRRGLELVDSPFHGPVADAVLFVPRLFGRILFPASLLQLAISFCALLLLAALFLELALRMNVSFEEASIRASQKRTETRLRRLNRTGSAVTFPRIPPPFALSPRSGPVVAIVWKNLTAGLRIASPWLLIMFVTAAYFVGQAAYSSQPAIRGMMGAFALGLACLFPLIGSRVFGQDMRLDLPRIDLLKSYPISGEHLVAAEIAAPLAFVSAVEIMLLTATALIMRMAGLPKKMAFFATPEFMVTTLMFATPVCALLLLMHNAVPILLPGWATRGSDEQRGFVVLGQRLLMMAGSLLVLGLAMIPAACILVPAFWIAARWFQGSPELVLIATVPSAAILFAEAWLGIRVLGSQFEKIDVSNEIDTVAA